jgi:polyhydroxyalkanoate synthase
VTTEALARLKHFMKGLTLYRHHPMARDVAEAPVVWHQGTTKVRDYNPNAPEAPLLLVIPSLINRFDILDLTADHSFLRTLAQEGFRPCVVDWDHPGPHEKDYTLQDYLTHRLVPIYEKLTHKSKVPCHLLGYCMGGLLALALAQNPACSFKTLTLMATPWDFHQPLKPLGSEWANLVEQLEPTLMATGYLPIDVIQSLFMILQPLQTLSKFSQFAELDPASEEAKHFVLVEDWLNDGVPLTAPVARACLRDWYGQNKTAQGQWVMDDQPITPATLTLPSYLIVPGKDRIVPPESALPLARLLPHATLHEPMLGHIGMMASRQAPHQVWAPFFHWLHEHG